MLIRSCYATKLPVSARTMGSICYQFNPHTHSKILDIWCIPVFLGKFGVGRYICAISEDPDDMIVPPVTFY